MRLPAPHVAFIFLTIMLLNGCTSLAGQSAGEVKMALTPVTETPSGENYPGKLTFLPNRTGRVWGSLPDRK